MLCLRRVMTPEGAQHEASKFCTKDYKQLHDAGAAQIAVRLATANKLAMLKVYNATGSSAVLAIALNSTLWISCF